MSNYQSSNIKSKDVENILTRDQLIAFRNHYAMRDSWHEPDEQDIDAFPAIGTHFDNASCDTTSFDIRYARRQDDGGIYETLFQVQTASHPNLPRGVAHGEHGVFLFHEGKPVAFINLALLLAMATGYEGFTG